MFNRQLPLGILPYTEFHINARPTETELRFLLKSSSEVDRQHCATIAIAENRHLGNMCFISAQASLMAQQVKKLPVMQETKEMQVQSLGQEDLLEEEMATHSSILAWKISWTEDPGELQSTGLQRVGHE